MNKKGRARARRKPVQSPALNRAAEQSASLSNSVLQLQAAAGNRAVRGLVAQLDLLAGDPHPGQQVGAESPTPDERGYLIAASPPSRTGGKRLPAQLRAEMESSFGAGFSNVKVHENQKIAKDLNAQAITVGNDIYFAPGRFQSHSGGGRQVIAHELTHVVQQRSARVKAPQGEGLPVNTDGTLENEARRLGRHASWRLPVKVRGAKDIVRRPIEITAQAKVSNTQQGSSPA